jgi:hypothetical protein
MRSLRIQHVRVQGKEYAAPEDQNLTSLERLVLGELAILQAEEHVDEGTEPLEDASLDHVECLLILGLRLYLEQPEKDVK